MTPADPQGVIQPSIPFSPPPNAIRINVLWFSSLLLSLSTAFLAILAKQWVLTFSNDLSLFFKDQARQRQFRHDNARRWKLQAFLSSLPVLLHISLLLFFAGMTEFTHGLNHTVYAVTTSIAAITVFVYVITHILTLSFASCPYKTSLAVVLQASFESISKEIYADALTLLRVASYLLRAFLEPWKQRRDTEGNTSFYISSALKDFSRMRTFFKRSWQDKTFSWSIWYLRELTAITAIKETVDRRTLAWMIGFGG